MIKFEFFWLLTSSGQIFLIHGGFEYLVLLPVQVLLPAMKHRHMQAMMWTLELEKGTACTGILTLCEVLN